MLKIFQATIRKSFLVSQSFLIDVNFFKWEAPVALWKMYANYTHVQNKHETLWF